MILQSLGQGNRYRLQTIKHLKFINRAI